MMPGSLASCLSQRVWSYAGLLLGGLLNHFEIQVIMQSQFDTGRTVNAMPGGKGLQTLKDIFPAAKGNGLISGHAASLPAALPIQAKLVCTPVPWIRKRDVENRLFD